MKNIFASILRPLFGYRYKVVYTETSVSGTFKKRYMGKIKVSEPNDMILNKLPTIHGDKYVSPVTLYYSKTPKNLGTRHLLLKKETAPVVFEAYFK